MYSLALLFEKSTSETLPFLQNANFKQHLLFYWFYDQMSIAI